MSVSAILSEGLNGDAECDTPAALCRKAEYEAIFDLLVFNNGLQFTPEVLSKFYSMVNMPMSVQECNSVFAKIISDRRPAIREKYLDRDLFVECMEKYHKKIDKNVENKDIVKEIQEYGLCILENNLDCALNLLNLPPDLSLDEVNSLLDAMR